MKKTYIAPKAKGIELQFEGLIAESLTESVDNTPTDIDGGDSNRRGIWGDTE